MTLLHRWPLGTRRCRQQSATVEMWQLYLMMRTKMICNHGHHSELCHAIYRAYQNPQSFSHLRLSVVYHRIWILNVFIIVSCILLPEHRRCGGFGHPLCGGIMHRLWSPARSKGASCAFLGACALHEKHRGVHALPSPLIPFPSTADFLSCDPRIWTLLPRITRWAQASCHA